MDILNFAHHFFHFESSDWQKLKLKGLEGRELAAALFHENLLPKRALRGIDVRNFDHALKIHEELLREEEALGIRTIKEGDPDYPEAIRDISPERRPALLYLRGAPLPEEKNLVSIVGTRKPSALGMDAAKCFSSYLAALKIQIGSGLARGIDTIAHERGLTIGTVAVLGGDVGHVYPEENQNLAEQILTNGGSLLSSFPLRQIPLPQNFPARNEILAAISAGVIVVEGAKKSGAVITGRHALALGKTVVALTQDFRSDFGQGAILLNQEGAVLVTSEAEAIEAIYRRFGGFSKLPLLAPTSLRKTFTFQDFYMACGKTIPEAVALLEEGILLGKIERLGARYRLR